MCHLYLKLRVFLERKFQPKSVLKGVVSFKVNRSLPPVIYVIFGFPPVIFFLLTPIKKICFDLSPSRPNKN